MENVLSGPVHPFKKDCKEIIFVAIVVPGSIAVKEGRVVVPFIVAKPIFIPGVVLIQTIELPAGDAVKVKAVVVTFGQ